ncbi:1-acyl-sn-glycerol-3-phosphate acyltransferase [Marinilongibacter aquaticus]|uniref:1-acyl-sn-glycerol-3-phosphate acyltransferase n=1 Tax=Marinilongibacter aquaticus TaxID=2975157 RepID=UPI0021BD431F|nr:1-acyl-sn-glycerol-3-phosphate acyltransferase [Marinilongibacter aquaticus]UBM57318.1 1-acyl-sn-glycerol-3-phosphate acyltransferase [Marinilongibacter aquaticus]
MKYFLYLLLRFHGNIVVRFFIKRLEIEGLENIPKNQPILYASTHFNSFFDSCITHLITSPKVHALARGDAFKGKRVTAFLEFLFILPIWRISDGKENMHKNAETFDKCQDIFRNGQHVLIYPEGICKHQKDVLPLKMGTANMIHRAWDEKLNVAVVPMVLTYDSYSRLGKLVKVNFGPAMQASDFDISDEKEFKRTFTDRLFTEMKSLVSYDFKPFSIWKNPLFVLGNLINFPIYLSLKNAVKHKFGRTVFFDSVWYGVLMFVLPLYWLLLLGIAFWIF